AARAVIDPEALLLVSASLRASERRLDDALAWCAAESALLSVQRTSSLLRTFPASAKAGLAAFAAEAVKAGDGRWGALAKGRSENLDLASREKRGEPRLTDWPALWLRLRACSGVGLKADLLALLLAANGQVVTIQTLTNAAGYTP